MSFENYLARATAPVVEIRNSLRPEEIGQLCSLLTSCGYTAHCTYVSEHIQEIVRYIGLSESQRSQKKWTARPDSIHFRFAAYQISYATETLQSELEQAANIAADHGTYRKFHGAIAGAVFPALFSHPLSYWPWDNVPNPFL